VAEAARSAAARAGMASEEGLVEQARFMDALKLQGSDSYALDDSQRRSGAAESWYPEAAGVMRLSGQHSGAFVCGLGVCCWFCTWTGACRVCQADRAL